MGRMRKSDDWDAISTTLDYIPTDVAKRAFRGGLRGDGPSGYVPVLKVEREKKSEENQKEKQ